MSAAVLLSLAVGRADRDRSPGAPTASTAASRPRSTRCRSCPAFAYLMPIVILFSVGPAAAVICTMIYAIPPAVRITALGIRGVTGGRGRGGERVRLDARADAVQGAAPAGAPAAAAGAQPDDHVRALARRDRGPDRRPRPRRRRDQRALLERRARAPRRHRDRDHGDRARPRDLRDRRPHRSDPPAPHRRGPAAGAPAHARHLRGHRRDRARRPRARRRQHLPGRVRDGHHRLHGHDRGHAAGLDPGRARLRPGPDLVHVRDHRADRQLPARVHARAAADGARRDALVHRARRPHRDRLRDQRAAPGDHGVR